jgi:hypothetical protein
VTTVTTTAVRPRCITGNQHGEKTNRYKPFHNKLHPALAGSYKKLTNNTTH